MADQLTIKDVLSAVQQTDRTVGSLVGHVKASTAASERVAEGVERLTDTIASTRGLNGKRNGPVTWPMVLMLVAAIGSPAAFVLSSMRDDAQKHQDSEGHAVLSRKVHKLEKVVEGEEGRNDKIETVAKANADADIRWRLQVVGVDTAQSLGIEQTHGQLCVLWSKAFPEQPCPTLGDMPRVEP